MGNPFFMWQYRSLKRIDYSFVLIISLLMLISLFVISTTTTDLGTSDPTFFTPLVKNQLKFFVFGWIAFIFCAGFDYRKAVQWAWFFYPIILILLVGLFFTASIHNVHRWYRMPLIGIYIQPSEYAKLIIVMCLSAVLERNTHSRSSQPILLLKVFFIIALPFILILKQPDLGTASILFPLALGICYFARFNEKILKVSMIIFTVILAFIFLVFTDVLSHDKMRPFFTKFLKEYQYERLNPHTYHNKMALTSIALGGVSGSGWHKSAYSSKKILPAGHTDSVFAVFAEEFGLLGIFILLSLFYLLLHKSFIVVRGTKDELGRLLASGITVYLTMHIIVNIAMMCGFLPISGVPLLLITYGGSSVVSTMAALGVLQNIYIKRFMF